jgi:hypothetical protein
MAIKMTDLYAHFCHCEILDTLFVPKCSTDIHGLCDISTKIKSVPRPCLGYGPEVPEFDFQVVHSGTGAHRASVAMVSGLFWPGEKPA